MNDLLLNILSVVVTAIVLPLISFLGVKLTEWLNTKIKDEKGQVLMKQATDIVVNAVRSVFQTYVEGLKKSGGFDKDAQIYALTLAKDTALKQLSDETKEYITKNFGDLGEWLTTQIEATINLLKN